MATRKRRRRRRGTTTSSPQQSELSPGQAKYVLDRLVNERQVAQSVIQRYVNEMKREIGELERRLASLREAAGEVIRGAISAMTPGRRRGRPPGGGAKKAAGGTKRRSRITAEQLASRQLQGRYLGLIRQIPASRRGQYQKIAKERGRESAIKEMQSALNK